MQTITAIKERVDPEGVQYQHRLRNRLHAICEPYYEVFAKYPDDIHYSKSFGRDLNPTTLEAIIMAPQLAKDRLVLALFYKWKDFDLQQLNALAIPIEAFEEIWGQSNRSALWRQKQAWTHVAELQTTEISYCSMSRLNQMSDFLHANALYYLCRSRLTFGCRRCRYRTYCGRHYNTLHLIIAASRISEGSLAIIETAKTSTAGRFWRIMACLHVDVKPIVAAAVFGRDCRIRFKSKDLLEAEEEILWVEQNPKHSLLDRFDFMGLKTTG